MTLTEATRRALGTNSSLLMSTSQDVEGDKWFTTQMGATAPGILQSIDQYHFLAASTQSAKRSAPYRVGGLSLQHAFRDLHRPERIPELEAQMDRAFRPRTIRKSLELIRGHDDRVLHALRTSPGAPAPVDLPPLEEPARFGDVVFE